MNRFAGKTAWITGASSGIGEALAYNLARQGCRLILSSNQPEELSRVCSTATSMGATCKPVVFDLSEADSIAEIVEKVLEEYPVIDFLFNNGGMSQRSLVLETPLVNDRRIMEINYFSNIALTKALLPSMINQGGGHIAVTSSLSGLFGFPLRSAYCASKHALHGFYETLRIEHKKENIRVTLACPDRVKTQISMNALAANGKEYGKMDVRQDKGISADQCAKAILKAVRKNRFIVLIGGAERFSVYLKRYFPWLFYRMIGNVKPT